MIILKAPENRCFSSLLIKPGLAKRSFDLYAIDGPSDRIAKIESIPVEQSTNPRLRLPEHYIYEPKDRIRFQKACGPILSALSKRFASLEDSLIKDLLDASNVDASQFINSFTKRDAPYSCPVFTDVGEVYDQIELIGNSSILVGQTVEQSTGKLYLTSIHPLSGENGYETFLNDPEFFAGLCAQSIASRSDTEYLKLSFFSTEESEVDSPSENPSLSLVSFLQDEEIESSDYTFNWTSTKTQEEVEEQKEYAYSVDLEQISLVSNLFEQYLSRSAEFDLAFGKALKETNAPTVFGESSVVAYDEIYLNKSNLQAAGEMAKMLTGHLDKLYDEGRDMDLHTTRENHEANRRYASMLTPSLTSAS